MSESPFIKDTQIQFAWDSTSLGLIKECPRKYYLTMIEGWRSKGTSMHLTFGLHFHKALERYDLFKSEGMSSDEAEIEAVMLLLNESYGWETFDTKKNRDTLVRSVVWYLDAYKEDVAQTIILSNGKPAVELSFRFETPYQVLGYDTSYMLSGHMDRLVDFGGSAYVMDRKTSGSTLGSYYFDQFNPDNQMTLYTLASKIVYDMPVQGVMIDAAQIAVGFTAFSRGITLRSNAQLDEWLEDFSIWMDTARNYAERKHWPMNEKSCNNYGKCVFRDICNKDSRVREKFLETDFEKSFWNPLEVR